MRGELVAELQQHAARHRCRWVFTGTQVTLQRRVGGDSGYWLSIGSAALPREPSEAAVFCGLMAYLAVASGELKYDEAVALLSRGGAVGAQ